MTKTPLRITPGEAATVPVSYAMSRDYEALYDLLCKGGEARSGDGRTCSATPPDPNN